MFFLFELTYRKIISAPRWSCGLQPGDLRGTARGPSGDHGPGWCCSGGRRSRGWGWQGWGALGLGGKLGMDGGRFMAGEPLVGRDCFSLVNDFRKPPAKYRLTSGQVITIMWEAAAQPGYRDCFGAVRCISPVQWLSWLGSPFPSQQLRWPPESVPPPNPHVHKVTRPAAPGPRQQPRCLLRGNSHCKRQPSRSYRKGGWEGTRSYLRGHVKALLQRGPSRDPGSHLGRGASPGESAGKAQPVGAVTITRAHPPVSSGLCAWGGSAQRPGQALEAGGH